MGLLNKGLLEIAEDMLKEAKNCLSSGHNILAIRYASEARGLIIAVCTIRDSGSSRLVRDLRIKANDIIDWAQDNLIHS